MFTLGTAAPEVSVTRPTITPEVWACNDAAIRNTAAVRVENFMNGKGVRFSQGVTNPLTVTIASINSEIFCSARLSCSHLPLDS
jgi:hypothetical protein